MFKPLICLVLIAFISPALNLKSAENVPSDGARPPLSAEAILQRHMAAAGGREALEKIRSQINQLDVQEGGEAFEAQVSFKDGAKVLINVSLPNGTSIRQGFDGRGNGWRQDPTGVRELKGESDLLDFHELCLCLSAGCWATIAKTFPQLSLVGEEKVGALDCQVIEVKNDQGPLKLCFDSKTGLLAKTGSSELSDYRSENGLQIPHLIRKGNGSILKVRSVKFNGPLDDKQFVRPSGPAAVATASPSSQMLYATVLNRGASLGVTRHPTAVDFGRPARRTLPAYRADSPNSFQVDLRGTDVSAIDLTGRLADLSHADFDSRTVWPRKLPAGFDPAAIMEQAKNPGLRLKALHAKGITGQGVGLAVIDQTLLVDHVEYKDQLRSYEEIHAPKAAAAQMHGPAVASIAVGKTVGVAPGADLYYIAETHGTFAGGKFDWDFTWLAQSIDRIVEINAALPKDKKIRVISISVGWSQGQKGFAEADAAVQRAKEARIFVISTAIEHTHQLAFHGLGRDLLKDPDQYTSYGLGSWWASSFLKGQRRFEPGQRLLVPMDARTTASPTGERDYVFYAAGGWSWSVPYIAGLYALACQVQPEITPEAFWSMALKTGRVITVTQEGASFKLGNIVDPVALIEALQKTSS